MCSGRITGSGDWVNGSRPGLVLVQLWDYYWFISHLLSPDFSL